MNDFLIVFLLTLHFIYGYTISKASMSDTFYYQYTLCPFEEVLTFRNNF